MRLMVLLAILAFLVFVYVSGEVDPPSEGAATMAEFSIIQEGMTYSQVTSIIGSPGQVISSSSLGGYTTVMYQWEGSGSFGANMNAMFQDGRLISKAQFGLQ